MGDIEDMLGTMISLDKMKWYHKMWFVPMIIIWLVVQILLIPFYLLAAPFRKK